jgi:hypothetical protein
VGVERGSLSRIGGGYCCKRSPLELEWCCIRGRPGPGIVLTPEFISSSFDTRYRSKSYALFLQEPRSTVVLERPYLIYLVFPTLLAIAAFFFISSAHGYKEVSLHEKTTMGAIITHQPENHNRYSYRFQVDGQTYDGSETPLKEEPRIGQFVTVHYNALNPAENSLTAFSERSDKAQATGIAMLCMTVACTAAVLILGPWLRKSKT